MNFIAFTFQQFWHIKWWGSFTHNVDFGIFWIKIILTSLFYTCRLYRVRQKPANGTQCPTLTTRDLLQALAHRHDDTWAASGEPVVGISGDRSHNVETQNI